MAAAGKSAVEERPAWQAVDRGVADALVAATYVYALH